MDNLYFDDSQVLPWEKVNITVADIQKDIELNVLIILNFIGKVAKYLKQNKDIALFDYTRELAILVKPFKTTMLTDKIFNGTVDLFLPYNVIDPRPNKDDYFVIIKTILPIRVEECRRYINKNKHYMKTYYDII